jgi:surfeit locus 1 family protein
MFFRPYPLLTVLALPIVAALVWLGMWQSDRAGWKADLIDRFQRASEAPPVPVADAICRDDDAAGRVVARPPVSGQALRVFGQNAAGAPGWRTFQATPGCGTGDPPVLMQTGFEALEIGDLPFATPKSVSADRYMVEPFPSRAFMAAGNLPDRNEWHWFDAPAMARGLGLDAIDTRYILVPFEGLPDHLTRTPPSRHVGYAVTWYGMAAAFVLIYAAFHARAGRLRFSKPGPDRQ